VIRLDDLDYTIIGVMPPYYDLWGGKLWIPLQLDFANNNRSNRRNWIVAVLRAGVSEAQANARLRTLSKQLEQQYGITAPEYHDWDLSVWNIKEAVVGGVKPALLVLAGAVALLILIVCANVAVLLLVRATSRLKEIALRVALGARRARLVRQMLTESLLLSFAGAAAGVCLSAGCLPTVGEPHSSRLLADGTGTRAGGPRRHRRRLRIAVLTGILFGIAPALQISKQDFVESLKESGSKIGGSRFGRLVRNALIITEIALSLVVLAGAALMAESYRHPRGDRSGVSRGSLAELPAFSLPETKYRRGDQIAQFFDRALQEMGSAPRIEGVAAVSGQPMGDRAVDLASRDFTMEGRPSEDARATENACFRVISRDYFRTMGARILRGPQFLGARWTRRSARHGH